MKRRIILLLFIGIPVVLYGQQYSIIDFGAKTGDSFINTRAIQAAIDQCNSKGGGEVVVPAGVFYTGTIFLKSNVYLHLMPGSVVQGSYRAEDYPEHPIGSYQKFGTITHNGLYVDQMRSLIFADNAENVGIIGQGTVKGAGEGQAFQLGLNKNGKPKNIFFIGCTNVTLKGISVSNSAQVTISISKCDRVFIDGLLVNTTVNWNCDGIDIDARDAVISNCIIESEDDALCFKSEYLGRFCENITVTNCVVSTMCNGIKLGTGSRTGFRNINVSNCVIKKASKNDYFHWKMTPDIVLDEKVTSVNTGIVILGVDGGLVENIHFSDIIMTDVLSPIFIRVGERFLDPDKKPSVMRNISIQNITAHTRSIIPSIIAGLEKSPVQDVRLKNIRISIPIAVTQQAFKEFPAVPLENVKGYPENRLVFGERLPGSAFYVRHAQGIDMSNIIITQRSDEARPAFYFDDVHSVRLGDILVNGNEIEKKKNWIGSRNVAKKAILVDRFGK